MAKYVYLIRQEDTTLFKIGVSKHPEKRLLEVQTGNGNKLILVEYFETKFNTKLESCIHAHFKLKRVNLEWFDIPLEDVKNFKNICQLYEDNLKFLKQNNSVVKF
jgi:predicted GIY-YIG superfamily endonuclease